MKNRKKSIFILTVVVFLLLGLFSGIVTAEEKIIKTNFPKKEINLIVPWNPGGSNDVAARHLQQIFKNEFDINLVVKNMPGGGSAVGIMEVINSKNDGYTLGLATSSFISLVAQGLVDVDMSKIENISLIIDDFLVAVCKTGKYNTLKDFVEDAKSRPGEAVIAISGINNLPNLYGALLVEESGTDINLMSYDGGARCVTELLGGRADISIDNIGNFVSQIQAGELTLISVMERERANEFPDVPTPLESGYDLFSLGFVKQFSYVMAPPGTDADVQEAIEDLFTKAILTDEFKKFAEEVGFRVNPIVGKDLDAMINVVYEGMKLAGESVFTK